MSDLDGTLLKYRDYYDTPQAQFTDRFDYYLELMVEQCDKTLLDNPDLNQGDVEWIYETILDLSEATPRDFSFDIYVPPLLCDFTGEIYLRPGNQAFNNPKTDLEIKPPLEVKQFLHRVITEEIPQLGFTLSCDTKLYEIAKMKSKLRHLQEKFSRSEHVPSPVHRLKKSKSSQTPPNIIRLTA